MLIAFAGITGIGKSYYKDKLVENLDFKKIKIITTRQIRDGEKNNDDKVFVSLQELEKLRAENKIAYEFEMLGNIYAYSKNELFSNDNTVFELHYSTIFDFKKICPKLCVIYLMPKDINKAKEKTIQRNLPKDVEEKRLAEIEEHYNNIKNDANLRNMFDYIVYNDYDKQSESEILSLVSNLIKQNKKGTNING